MFPMSLPNVRPDVVTTVYPEEVDYLRAHPDVRCLATAPAEAWDGRTMVTLALWMRDVSEAEYATVLAARHARGRRRPERKPDLELSGEALVPATFFDRLPNLETFVAIEEPEEPYWAAKIWLTSGPVAAAV